MKTEALRIIDAALNRAAEGMRVVEDYVRFVLDDAILAREAKSLRHDLATAAKAISAVDRHAARDTRADVGTQISAPAESQRHDPADVCAASLKRTQQALRSLEEYGKLVDDGFAASCEELRYRLYTLEKAIDVSRTSRDRLVDVRLCVLLDARDSVADFEQLVRELVDAGVGMIQLREKHLDDRELIERARLLVALTRRQPPALPGVSGVREQALRDLAVRPPAEPGANGLVQHSTLAVINDRADVAAIVRADGVHLGQEDLSVKDARAIVGTRMLIGVSTHNIDQARAAVLDGANYLGAGPTFPSQTKAFDDFAGLDYLREVAAETRLPTFAIGGIAPDNLPGVLAAGISRVAVGAAVTDTANPGVAVRELLVMLNTPAAHAASSILTPDS